MSKATLRKNGCIYCVVTKDTVELSKLFVRLQEFYESPFKEIRRQHFTLKQFKTIYSKSRDGIFTYYDDWAGFNVPGDVVLEFFRVFTDLSTREKHLKKLLLEALTAGEVFYVIGYPRGKAGGITEHEYAHALFYTDPTYRREMKMHGKRLPMEIRNQIFSKLKAMGYCGIVRTDELQAYLATSKAAYLTQWFGRGIKAIHTKRFKETFYHYYLRNAI